MGAHRGRKSGSLRGEALRREIEAAFSTVPHPGDDRLVVSNDPAHLECREIASAFRGRRWQDIPLQELRRHHQSMCFMTPEAVRYFLPAYMLACLKTYAHAGNIPDSLIARLVPPRPEGPGLDLFTVTMNGLTTPQRRAVRSFIEHMVAEHGRDDALGDWSRALRRFWADAGR